MSGMSKAIERFHASKTNVSTQARNIESEQLARDVAEFVACGGVIEQINSDVLNYTSDSQKLATKRHNDKAKLR